MHQKGFIIAPVILWILGAVLVTGVAVKEGAISIEYPPKTQEEVAINVPSPTPLPTYKPTPTPSSTPISKPTQKPVVQQGIQTNQTTQGRTGRIVKYKEYCKGGKEISVYESELITKKAADGNTYSMTKDDWDCSERDQKQKQNPPTQPATINCYDPVTKKNYQVSKETCDKWVQEYNKGSSNTIVTIPCNTELGSNFGYGYSKEEAEQNCKNLQNDVRNKLGGPLIDCKVYVGGVLIVSDKFTQSECDKLKLQASTPSKSNPQPNITETEAQAIIEAHNTQVTSCQSSVRSRYEGLLQSCYFYSGSTAQGCRQIYTDQRQREYDACGALY